MNSRPTWDVGDSVLEPKQQQPQNVCGSQALCTETLMGFQRMGDDLLIGKFGERRMAFPEVRGQLAVCLRDSIKNVPGEVAPASGQPC